MNRPACLYLALLLVFGLAADTAAAADKTVKVPLAPGAAPVVLNERVAGYDGVNFTFEAKAGSVLTAVLKSKQAEFNVLAPETGEALFNSSVSGDDTFEGTLPKDGTYRVQVYLMRAMARRNDKSDVTITLSLKSGSAPQSTAPPETGPTGQPVTQALAPDAATAAVHAATKGFDAKLDVNGISFQVLSANNETGNTVVITPKGLAIDNSTMTFEADGAVVNAEAGDINADGSPEVYVTVRGKGADQPAALIAVSTNNKKSMSMISVPPLSPAQAKGYRGQDDYAVVEGIIARRFPLYSADGKPTGKMRQLQYKLKPGEAAWTLKADKVLEF